jgi:hypothetical protein
MGHRVLAREENPDLQIDRLRKRVEALERRWHPDLTGAEGGGNWIMMGFSSDYVITSGQREILDFDVFAKDDPGDACFAIDDTAPGLRPSIRILQDGTYAVYLKLYLDVFTPEYPTDTNILISCEHVTWTHEEVVIGAIPPLGSGTDAINQLASPIIGGAWTFTSGPDYDPVYPAVSTNDPSDSDIGVIGGDLNISAFGVIKVDGAPAGQTDPNDYIFT